MDLAFFKDKKVLVTGHSGFKGSYLAKILHDVGANVAGYSLEPPTNPNLFSILGLENSIRNFWGDVRDFEHLKTVFNDFRPEIVFHLAAQPIVLTSYEKPRYTYETNVMGTVNVLECAREVGCVRSLLNVTTDKVYENSDTPNHLFKEDEKLDGYDPYSNSKSCSELVTHSYKKSFFGQTDTAISTARAGNVIGGGDFADNRIVPDCYRSLEKGESIKVRNRFSTRPYQYVLEPLLVYLLIARKQYENKKYEGYYNVGPDRCDLLSTGLLVSKFCEAWGGAARWEDQTDPNAPHEAACLALDNSLVKKTFGWRPTYSMNQTIQTVVEWYKGYIEHADMISLTERQVHCFLEAFQCAQ